MMWLDGSEFKRKGECLVQVEEKTQAIMLQVTVFLKRYSAL